MKLTNFPKTREGQLFQKMLMAGFGPIKNIIEYEKLEGDLTIDDTHQLGHAIAHAMDNWIEYLKKVNEEKEERNGR